MPPADFSNRLLQWFDEHGRKDLPWQKNPTPYRVWISEVMLQQTQVTTVVPYFERFVQRFPSIDALADADLDDVLHLWSGLGYYSRARNLHRTARLITERHDGEFPLAFARIIDLPGIGRSTAGAILALSANLRYPILDGNVKRVLARFHAVDAWPGSTPGARHLWALAEQYTPETRVAAYTQAIMDLGATVCTRSKPRCTQCPLASDCGARMLNTPTAFPVRKPRRQSPVRHTTMLMLRGPEGHILLERRPPAGIWGGLWAFPEYDNSDDIERICRRYAGSDVRAMEHWPVLTHTFSHFRLHIQPVLVHVGRAEAAIMEQPDIVWYNVAQPQRLGVAAPIKFLLDKLAEPVNESHG